MGGNTVNAVAAESINKGIEEDLGKRKLLFGGIGGAVTSLGASTLNGLGIDKDCDGNSGFDQFCQAIPGGGNTVNAVAAESINKGIEEYLGRGEVLFGGFEILTGSDRNASTALDDGPGLAAPCDCDIDI